MIGNNKFAVCVRCMTYNQRNYIEETLHGFCMQDTHFPFVCIIVDDASTDGEPEVIKKYLDDNFQTNDKMLSEREETNDYELTFARHKENNNCYFAVFLLKYNHWGQKDKTPYYIEWMNASKYLAICEGDDYWTDARKLENQVNFLEGHPDYALCYTKTLRNNNNKVFGTWGDNDCSFEGLLNGCIIPTLTRMERTSAYFDFLHIVKPHEHKWLMGDYANILFYSLKYKIGHLDGYSGVYRILSESTSHSADINKLIKFYDSADDVRYFFINRFVDDAGKRNRLSSMVKLNEVLYKLNQYTQRYMIKEAAALYSKESDIIPIKERVKYRLETFSEGFSPIFIFLFNIKQNFKGILKKIYISI